MHSINRYNGICRWILLFPCSKFENKGQKENGNSVDLLMCDPFKQYSSLFLTLWEKKIRKLFKTQASTKKAHTVIINMCMGHVHHHQMFCSSSIIISCDDYIFDCIHSILLLHVDASLHSRTLNVYIASEHAIDKSDKTRATNRAPLVEDPMNWIKLHFRFKNPPNSIIFNICASKRFLVHLFLFSSLYHSSVM